MKEPVISYVVYTNDTIWLTLHSSKEKEVNKLIECLSSIFKDAKEVNTHIRIVERAEWISNSETLEIADKELYSNC